MSLGKLVLIVLLGAGTGACDRSKDGGSDEAAPSDDDDGDESKTKSKKRAPSCEACGGEACRPGDAAACHELAVRHGHGRGVPYDLALRTRYDQRACDNDHARACTALASYHQDGVGGVPHSDSVAAVLYEKACALGDGDGCVQRGRMYQLGDIGPPDEAQADTWFHKGRALHRKQCEAGDARACFHLGDLHKLGWGLSPDPAEAYRLFEKSCGDFEKGCVYQALALLAGAGTAKDVDKGTTMLRASCDDRKHLHACTALGQELWLGRHLAEDLPQAAKLLTRACDEDNDPIACGALGQMLEDGKGVPLDLAESLRRRERACELRNSRACSEAAKQLLKGDRSSARARGFLQQGCHIGDAEQCVMLGLMHKLGRGGPADEATAIQLFGEGCRRRLLGACRFLVEAGRPLPLSEGDAGKMRAELCAKGVSKACTI